MYVGKYLIETTRRLDACGIQTGRLDCLVLLEEVLKLDRALLLAHPEIELSPAHLSILNKYIAQREKHVPLAYIRGTASFYGREFNVNTKVLVPRPETENMIDLLKAISLPLAPVIADIGTGSGCIGITAALEIPTAHVWLYDIEPSALAVASQNAQSYNAVVQIAQQNLLVDCREQFDIVLANLPYVPDRYPINAAARYEPSLALFAGKDGLDLYRVFWKQLTLLPVKPQHVIVESLTFQHTNLAKLAQQNGYSLTKTKGLVQSFTSPPKLSPA